MPQKPLRKPQAKDGVIAAGVLSVAVILGALFNAEGGFVDNPDDPGGATNHGVTERVARANGFEGLMQDLTKEEATDIAVRQYIMAPNFDDLYMESPAVAMEAIDSGYNVGPGRTSRWIQRALNIYSRNGRDYAKVAVDGQIGPATLRAFRTLQIKRGEYRACTLMIKAIDSMQAAHYINLVENSRWATTFGVGWFDHRVGNVDYDMCNLEPHPDAFANS